MYACVCMYSRCLPVHALGIMPTNPIFQLRVLFFCVVVFSSSFSPQQQKQKSIWTPRLGHGHKGDACVFASTKDFILQKVRSFVLSAGYRIHGSFSFVALLRTITTKWIVYKWVWQGKWKASRVFVCVSEWVCSPFRPPQFSQRTGEKSLGKRDTWCRDATDTKTSQCQCMCCRVRNPGTTENWKSVRVLRENPCERIEQTCCCILLFVSLP